MLRHFSITPDHTHFLYLASNELKTHNTCFQLKVFDLQSSKSKTILDVVERVSGFDSFPGLFCKSLPLRCFVDNQHILLSSLWFSEEVLLLVNFRSGVIYRLLDDGGNDSFSSWSVLDVLPERRTGDNNEILTGAHLLTVKSSPRLPHSIMYGYVEIKIGDPLVCEGKAIQKTIHWTPLMPSNSFVKEDVIDRIQKLHCEIMTLGVFPDIFQYIYISPRLPTNASTEQAISTCGSNSKISLIMYPHGGPHSHFSTEFDHSIAFLNLLGYAVMLVNYRGSLGFGKNLIDSLPGKCGTQDLQDCMQCLDSVRNLDSKLNTSKIFFVGGSHGGFIGAHLIGRYPDLFQAAVLRNPVINIATMSSVSDIPDWCIVETNAKDMLDYSNMLSCSPVIHAHNITAATLIVLGGIDRRVPNSQGMQLYYELKKRVPTRVILYPKAGHAITACDMQADMWVNIALWFSERK